ncbi:FAD:protein FMN transferase [Palleronia caenipelagi]|uniref:FAD:protein FMN transferase n=1 Tax=Palleronia caenipelagi TaxID=2489174 RepID=A0A547QA55_9RHOB|nr:FAD:protein FMN transferase [Palleronia caenipelagi]TRD23226.1 FAD:protein FMN transferase [Palleronia caenipelagi]
MTHALTRRRFVAISAALPLAGAAFGATMPETRWKGRALGASASLRIAGLAPDESAPVVTAVEAELQRLERIFSLYREDSALVRLNRTGKLIASPPELLEVLSLVDHIHDVTGGAFDPTVQPLFAALAHAADAGRSVSPEEMRAARTHVGWDKVEITPNAIRLPSGAALTLNGIAQGYITDRIASLLRHRGLTNILVNAGEIRALGSRPDGTDWQAGIADPSGALVSRLTLTDRALATSAPGGTRLGPSATEHILDPGTGTAARGAALVSVSAPTAMVADGLSTALCVIPPKGRAAVIAAFPQARIEASL